jgi:hypothetical protein
LPLDLPQTRRYARQIALPEVGSEGQQRLLAAAVVVIRDAAPDLPGTLADPAEAAATYLRAAGVGNVVVLPPPSDHPGWQSALRRADVVMRFALDDDGLLPAAIEAGVPVVLGRVSDAGIDLLAFRQQGACAHERPARPPGSADRAVAPGAAAVVLATLAAAECLWMLIDRGRPPAARLLRLPLDGGAPVSSEIPWPPACPLCAASKAKLS